MWESSFESKLKRFYKCEVQDRRLKNELQWWSVIKSSSVTILYENAFCLRTRTTSYSILANHKQTKNGGNAENMKIFWMQKYVLCACFIEPKPDTIQAKHNKESNFSPSQKMQSQAHRKHVVASGFWHRLHSRDGGGNLTDSDGPPLVDWSLDSRLRGTMAPRFAMVQSFFSLL